MMNHRMRMNTTVGRVAVLTTVSASPAGSLFRVKKCFGEGIVFNF